MWDQAEGTSGDVGGGAGGKGMQWPCEASWSYVWAESPGGHIRLGPNLSGPNSILSVVHSSNSSLLWVKANWGYYKHFIDTWFPPLNWAGKFTVQKK